MFSSRVAGMIFKTDSVIHIASIAVSQYKHKF